MPDRRRILGDLRQLLEQDWRNIEAGLYAPPEDWRGNPLAGDEPCRRFLRRSRRGRCPPPRRSSASACSRQPGTERYPAYYRRHFHFQSDGYLSAASAERYDHQVEVLFGGGAAAMRRQALVPLREALLETTGGVRSARLLDIACGTGGFLAEVKRNYPAADSDRDRPVGALSSGRASGGLPHGRGWRLPKPMPRRCPLPMPASISSPASICSMSCRAAPGRRSRREIRRVLKPGGRLIFVNSLQTGDEPDYDAMLDWFPVAFHEPYYASYLREDLDRLFGSGFSREARIAGLFFEGA